MAHFVALTKAPRFPGVLNAVIMGRNTWASLPASRRPLPGRINVVVSSESLFPAGAGDAANADTPVLSAATLHDAVQAAEARQAGVAFLIGGATLLREALSPECDLVTVVYRTRISGVFEASVKLMDMDLRPFSLVASMVRVKVLEFSGFAMDNVGVLVGKVCECVCVCVCVCCQPGTGCTFDMLRRCRVVAPAPAPLPLSEEVQYLDLAREVIHRGVRRGDRTGVGTLSVFGRTMRFCLSGGKVPVLTTKRVFWKGVVEELLWFIGGGTDARALQAKGVRIWDGNSTRDFLDGRGLQHYVEGDLGPVYGFQWRHFGAAYAGCDADYTGQGIDQLRGIIHALRTTPHDRRMVMTAWNPVDLAKMALPPCHMFCQFYVADGKLSCLMYQRSADVGLGVPFNMASYGLLTHLVAHVTGLEAHELVHVMGDAHVYLSHVEALQEQLERPVLAPFPTVVLDKDVADIDAFTSASIDLRGYAPQGAVKMPMAV